MTVWVYIDGMTNTTNTAATLYDYTTGDAIRPATAAELAASIAAAAKDGGAGVIETADVARAYAQ